MERVSRECSICQQPLPMGGPVAFVEKQQIIHVHCYRPVPPSARAARRPRLTAGGGARLREDPASVTAGGQLV